MATVCTNCGQDLPREDAHFCTHCGTLVPSHPFSAQSLSAANVRDQSIAEDAQKPVIREQMAHRQAEKPVIREQRVQQPRPRTTRRIAPDSPSASPVSWPAPITHVSVKKEGEQQAPQEFSPAQNTRVTPPERELHVKVWDQDNPPTPHPESVIEPVQSNQRNIEDAPTSPLEMPKQAVKEHVTSYENEASRQEIEQLDTTPIPNYAQARSAQQLEQGPQASRAPMQNVAPVSILPGGPQQQRQQNHPQTPVPDVGRMQQAPGHSSPQNVPMQRNVVAPIPSSAPVQRNIAAPISSAHVQDRRLSSSMPAQAGRQKSPVPFIILLGLLGILVLGGGAWILLAQPFSVSPVTQPLQDFKSTGLGIALSYPTSWTVQQTANSVLFADSSRTGQVKVQVTNTASDAATYVEQQAKTSGMTSLKPLGTTSFAGATWQQVQGNMQQEGANYTATMLATTHGNRVYLLIQMAPQNVYNDEESVVFSAMRNSFKFL